MGALPSQNRNTEVEVADVFKRYSHKLPFTTKEQRKVINAITSCRTSRLGGHVFKCDNCDNMLISYNSCRNRHCPKCQSLAKANWILDRKKELLPVPYFHIVFTISDKLYPLTIQNKKVVYNILFKAVSDTLKEVAANPKNLGAQIGFMAILHTWNQQLGAHPHIHCIVPGGGLSKNKERWIESNKNYFLCVKVLSVVFRGKFLALLKKAYNLSQLNFHGILTALAEIEVFNDMLRQSCLKNWVVYSKRPFAGPEQVLDYLGRYTHRVAISNNRILNVSETTVTFKWRDRKDNNKERIMSIDTLKFMRRFLLHILPSGFMKIRHYGFLGSPSKGRAVILCKVLLDVDDKEKISKETPKTWRELMFFLTGKDLSLCPLCNEGHMILFDSIQNETRPPPVQLN